MSQHATSWGARAAKTYDRTYAEAYRARDEGGEAIAALGRWLAGVCDRFDAPIDVLDLGCGTGRYFRFVRRARRLVGVDVSKPMLAAAEHPAGAVAAGSVTLIEADFLSPAFAPGRFDLVYSIGVLAEHSPIDHRLAARVRSWLRPAGRFAFTALDVRCPSIPRTAKRRAAEWLLPRSGPLRGSLRSRLLSGGLYADSALLEDLLRGAGFVVESIEPFQSDVHLHLLAVGRVPA
ncbi:MAG TPA: methyltransferase domain-containing protein [Vicinamibacterales bacterium]|nr:methyltransferase domain-containing protein [Vicinamibacterales bacterium]